MKQIIKKLAIVLSVALVCAPMGAMAANKLIVKDATGVIDKMVVTDTGYIGIGHSTPTWALHVIGSGSAVTTGAFFHNLNSGVVAPAAGNSPGMSFYRNNDSSVNPTWPAGNQLKSGDRLGYFSFGTKFGTTNKDLSLFQAYAESLHTPTSLASNMIFFTTSTGAVSPSEKLRIKADGMLEVSGSVRLKTPPASVKPVCGSANRGLLWYTNGVTGTGATADTLEVCKKNAADAYAWIALF